MFMYIYIHYICLRIYVIYIYIYRVTFVMSSQMGSLNQAPILLLLFRKNCKWCDWLTFLCN